jgi:hypothetical protein
MSKVDFVCMITVAFAASVFAARVKADPPSPPSAARPDSASYPFQSLDGTALTLRTPQSAEPAKPFEVTLETASQQPFFLDVDGRRISIQSGKPASVVLGGALGTKEIAVFENDRKIGTLEIRLQAETQFHAGRFTELFPLLRNTVIKDRSRHPYNGGSIVCNPTWVRDHIHEMKAYKFWANDLNSYIDALIHLQQPDGFFFEIVMDPSDQHLTFVKEKHRQVDAANKIGWVRLELEADVEYLMVEGAYAIWQATGDRQAMAARLPALERALNYCFTDPTRWDEKHGALKRPFTPDTWDFTYGKSDHNRRIDPDTPMAIMHGDNSGLYAACRQLAAMLRVVGEEAKAQAWEAKAAALRDRVNRLCFNGKYYTHQILLQPVETGVKEEDILSLSNTYDINRGLPTHEMAVQIIDEYQRRRELRAKTHFAEWFSIDPPYPLFGPYSAGQYINGGIASFAAGELAKAALNEGRENYGADILNRLAQKIADDKAIYFLYTVDGKNQNGGPSGWSAAAVISALVEGLAGIHDEAAQFEKLTISPRFVAAKIDSAHVCVKYGPSTAYVAIDYLHDPSRQEITLQLSSVAKAVQCRILLPDNATSAHVVFPADIASRVETLEQSRYCVFDLPESQSDNCKLQIQYQSPKPPTTASPTP